MSNVNEKVTLTFGRTTLTRRRTGRSRGYGWTSARWECDTCGTVGLGDDMVPHQWAISCARGHIPCQWCGKQLTVLQDGTARVHTQCKERPEWAKQAWHKAKVEVQASRTRDALGVPSDA